MKKSLFIVVFLLAAMLMPSCRIGSQSVSSGMAEECYISFFAPKKYDIQVTVDGQNYQVQTIRDKEWRNDRNIKKTVQNRIKLQPGKHDVTVSDGNNQVYKKTIFISTNEYKIIDL